MRASSSGEHVEVADVEVEAVVVGVVVVALVNDRQKETCAFAWLLALSQVVPHEDARSVVGLGLVVVVVDLGWSLQQRRRALQARRLVRLR